ncbi:MAG: methionyl-tRNA formyltransferase [Fibrobacteria bacterium]|nr:methionyl-tRNA formyltransferase [Fibrobacteria bacterium]
MKIVFLGTPPIAARCLEHLQGTEHEIAAVCTHPDRLMGRGLKPHPTAVKEVALRFGLPVREVPDVKDPSFAAWLSELGADLLVVVAFVILPGAVLATTRLGAINLHGSLLPRWRGAAPVQRSIEAGEPVTGVSVFRLDNGVDTGGILLQRTLEVGPDETSGEVLARMGEIGGPALEEALALLSAEAIPSGTRQDPALATRAPKLTPEEGRIDWSLPAPKIHDKIRAFHPAPGCWSELRDETTSVGRVKIWRTKVVQDSNPPGDAGALLWGDAGKAMVRCGEGSLELLEVQAEGKPRRGGADWLRGLRARSPRLS